MKNIFKYIIQNLALFFVLMGFVFITSCDDEDPMNTDEVVLLSFGPSGVVHGDEIVFIGNNMDKVTSIVLPPEITIEKSDFIEASKGSFKVIVPQGAEAGKVILNTTDGQIESKTLLNFLVDVQISSITEEAKPGTNISIKGDKINWIERVTFTSDIVVEKDDFVSQSLNELVVTVPIDAQSGFLIFATGGTEPMTFASEEELKVSLPAVTDLSPGAVKHTDELTISGENLDLVTEIVFSGDVVIGATEFISQSSTEIVVPVPVNSEDGSLTLRQISPVEVTTDQEITIILPAAESVSPSPAVPGEDVMTITGTNLDLIAEIILPGSGAISNFTSQSATEIVFDIPANATQGALEYITIHGYEAPLQGALLKLPPTGDFPSLDYYIYSDGLQNGWQAYGGWGHVSQEYENGENPANGDLAIKTVFNDPYGAVQINNTSGPDVFSGYNYLVFYVYVQGEESDIIAQIGDNSDFYPPHFIGDKWHQIVVPLADLQGSDNVNELRIKNNNGDAATNNTVVFIDEIGLTVEEPLGLLPDLFTVIFDDELKSPFGEGGGWGGTSFDTSNEENARGGSVAVKTTFVGGYGGACQFGTWGNTPLSTAGMEYVSFSIYGESGTDGNTIQLNVKSTTDGTGTEGSAQVTIEEGKWTDYQVALSDLGNPTSIGEISFQDTDWSGTVFIDHIGLQ